MIDVPTFYARFFELGGPPRGSRRPWHYRRRETSLRLPGCELLARLMRDRRPRRVLDLGSGITSLLLRTLAVETGAHVVTTDTSDQWLAKTVAELKRDGLSLDDCLHHELFERLEWEPFGLVSLDADNLQWRIDQAESVAGWLAPDGILVLDDFGMRDYAERMTETLEGLGLIVTPHHDTLDEYGCYMATATRRTA